MEPYLTVRQVAERLDIQLLDVVRAVQECRLPAAEVANAYRIRKSILDWFADTLLSPPESAGSAEKTEEDRDR